MDDYGNGDNLDQDYRNVKLYDGTYGSYDAFEHERMTALLNGSGPGLVGKTMVFTSTGTQYEIEKYYKAATTHWVVLKEAATSSDTVSANTPVKIIDSNTRGYKLKVTRAMGGVATAERYVYDLDSEFVLNPSYVILLKTGHHYYFEMKSYNGDSDGQWVSMSGSSFDPDHNGTMGGGQAVRSYARPMSIELPYIIPTGTLTLQGTAFGFNIQVAGWETYNDYENTAHN